MDRKDVLATVLAAAAVAVLSAILILTILERSSGALEAGAFVNRCVSLTGVLSFVVLIYGAFMLRDSGSPSKRYEEYARSREDEGDEGRQRP